ncbi:Zn-ribbon domain-containing OB-fold protein [Paraburkholderia sp. IW21]|jgi:uncharacterized protein|uniref:Zn-ribbon domain-containing OB-fold protein n=1 Tax=Paraburkholderia sp. IW21 TaxID=3242488 RepID=UPI00352138C5
MSDVHPDQEFASFLAAGRFMLQRARNSGHYVFPPRIAEPGSGSRDLEWVEASGCGVVYSLTVVAQKPPAPDSVIVLVDLDEGPRILSRLNQTPPTDGAIGAAVRARIVTHEGEPLLTFDLVDFAKARVAESGALR